MDWEQRYQSGDTPWDLDGPSPALAALTAARPEFFSGKKVLVPGCGRGHDALHLAGVAAEVTGFDLAPGALKEARKLDLGNQVRWIEGDFLAGGGGEGFEVIWEHTCFCAIPVDRQRDYVAATGEILPRGGFLAGIFFLDPPVPLEDGPPFGVSLEKLRSLFGKNFDLEMIDENPSSVPDRVGREVMLLWRRK